MSTIKTELEDCIDILRSAVFDLKGEVSKQRPVPGIHLARLQAAIVSLGIERQSKPLHCLEQYEQQWKDFQKGRLVQLERRAIRHLCWQPEIATSKDFQSYLDDKDISLDIRSLQGLIRSCHSRWSPKFANSQEIGWVLNRLKEYPGRNHWLTLWKDNSSVILGSNGTAKFSMDMIKKMEEIKLHCESWGITEATCAYVQEAVSHASKKCRAKMDKNNGLREYLVTKLLPWSGWSIDRFKNEVSYTVLHPVINNSNQVKDLVRDFVLNDKRLGDPRLTYNRINWVGMEDAKTLVVEWLSHQDIVFFFDHILPTKNSDPHGRKDFWLKYVSRVLKSRPLLSDRDKYKVERSVEPNKRKLLNFGLMQDASTSAFLLDFGPLVAIEFSESGNACYLYDKKVFNEIVPDFYTTKEFTINQLKQRKRVVKRVNHRDGKNWEDKISQFLAGRKYNIRPGGSN